MADTRNRTPVRNGRFYCSQACAGGKLCTWNKYQKACADAAALAKRMGPGWTVQVWENLGWWYQVSNGGMELHPHQYKHATDKPFTLYVQGHPQYVFSGKDPVALIRLAVNALRLHWLDVDRRLAEAQRIQGTVTINARKTRTK